MGESNVARVRSLDKSDRRMGLSLGSVDSDDDE